MRHEIYFDELTVADRAFLRKAKIRVPLVKALSPKLEAKATAPGGEVIAMLALAAVALGCVAVWLIASGM